MTLDFHYIKLGRPFGPVDEQDFLSKYELGVIADEDLVRVDGDTSWRPAYDVVARLRAGLLRPSAKPGRVSSGSPYRAAGSQTVFTTAPPAARREEPARPKLKKCTHCGTRTAKDAAFCHRCGGDLSCWSCPGCLELLERGAKFCGHCGKAL